MIASGSRARRLGAGADELVLRTLDDCLSPPRSHRVAPRRRRGGRWPARHGDRVRALDAGCRVTLVTNRPPMVRHLGTVLGEHADHCGRPSPAGSPSSSPPKCESSNATADPWWCWRTGASSRANSSSRRSATSRTPAGSPAVACRASAHCQSTHAASSARRSSPRATSPRCRPRPDTRAVRSGTARSSRPGSRPAPCCTATPRQSSRRSRTSGQAVRARPPGGRPDAARR